MQNSNATSRLTGFVLGVLFFSLPGFAATNVVEMGEVGTYYYYNPTNITINAGGTILWTNVGTVAHDTRSRSNLWSSPNLVNGGVFTFTFTNSGEYPYFCFFHRVAHPEQTGTVSVVSANLAPSVALTNPANNAKFRGPASILLQASASDGDGSVTNVQFFSGATPLGSVTAAPYNFTASSIAAGNYSFTARATDNGGNTSTSAIVNVFVLTNAVLQNPVRLDNGQFRMTILGIAGQTYAAESSTNLTDWAAFATNVAPANSFNVTDFTSTNILHRFFRARQNL